MNKQTFVYVTYIQTTPEKAWRALVDSDLTRMYWGKENHSDWKPGSRWEMRDLGDAREVMVVGKVVETTPPRRLVMTWARPREESDVTLHSRVTFELEPQGDLVRLTVLHEDLDAKMAESITQGWPLVLSSLKTMLETGKGLPLPKKGK